MSKMSFEDKGRISLKEPKFSESSNKIISLKKEYSIDEKDDSEFRDEGKCSSDSPNTCCSENNKSFSQSYLNEQLFSSDDKKIKSNTDKAIPPEVTYFLCNEKYFKENSPEGNNYKKKSKNYLPKKEFNCPSSIQLEELNLNKINDILKDIEYLENAQNDANMKLNIDNISNNYIDFNNLDCNNLLNNGNAPNFVNNFFIWPYVNNYNYNCKFFY